MTEMQAQRTSNYAVMAKKQADQNLANIAQGQRKSQTQVMQAHMDKIHPDAMRNIK